MDDGVHKSGLYRWQRQAKPVVQSRTHRVASTNGIQDWIKKVEDASDKATDAAFGYVDSSSSSLSGKRKGRELALTHTRQARFEEEAHSEAQELLRQWVTDKVHFDADDGYDDLEAWRRARHQQKERENEKAAAAASSRAGRGNGGDARGKRGQGNDDYEDYDVESAADILNNIKLEDEVDWELEEAAIYERVKRSGLGNEDPYAHLYDMDENEAVSSVLKTLMSKDVVKEAFKKDLGFDDDKNKSVPDPRTRMELRQQMVKENREKRQKEELKKMKERQIKKEAKAKAQQMIMKEQKDKETQVRREEEEIKKEMMKMRKELTEENKKKEDKIRRDREEKDALERLAREELERQNYEEERIQLESRRNENDRRKHQMIKHEMWRAKHEAKNLKCLHLHFNAWYDLVLSRRLLLGKVKAMSDWKVMVRVWSAWKAYVRGQRAQVAFVQHEKEVIETHRKTLASENHYRHRLLRKCLTSWRHFVTEEVERREMEEEKAHTKNKMMSLLSAVAEGRFANAGKNDKKSSSSSVSGLDTDRSLLSNASSQRVNLYNNNISNNSSSSNSRSHHSSKQNHQNNITMQRNHPGGPRVQAWVEDQDNNGEEEVDDIESQCNSEFTRVTRTDIDSHHSSTRPHTALPRGNRSKSDKSKTHQMRLKSASSSSILSSRPASSMSSVTTASSSSATTVNRGGGGKKQRIPTEAWQVTKQHTRIPAEDICNLGAGELQDDYDDDEFGDGEDIPQNYSDAQIRKRFGTQPWMNRHYVVNNLEHRYNAQQKALRQQQDEIREQKRLIQDLQYQQQTHILHQQLASGVASPDAPPTVEAPPKGKEIPRDTDDIANCAATRGEGGVGGNIVIHSGNTSTTITSTAAAKPLRPFGHVEEDGQITDRSGLTTQRTESEASKASSTNSHNTKYLLVLKNMEERSAHRARQKAEREEKRRKQEEEKLAELEKLEAERLREIEEEKKARVEAYRHKKRIEKQKEEERQKESVRQQELMDRAKAHYQRSIMKYRGLLPLKKLISLSKRNWNKAVKQHNQTLVKQCLQDWQTWTQSEIERKNKMADQMGQFLLIKHCFERWRKHKYHTEFLLRRADRHHEKTLRAKVFYVWLEWKDLEKAETARRVEMAGRYYWDHLLKSRFLAWKGLPEKQKREEERKKRKMEMRARVAELIPDFAPRQSVEQRGSQASGDFG